ncbi:MAG: response regulator [Myxococcota bacterium]|nr:response regulator [Myxococcota bacterium]
MLVVEDDFSSCEVLVMLLEGEGLDVAAASNGEEALKRLDADPRIGLIITDYMMPTLNGIDLCRKLEADPRFRRIPVILMSATYISSETLPPQISAVFGKPLLFDKLISKVLEILGATARGPELT